MTVEQSVKTVQKKFNEEPQYSAADGLLSLQSSGCKDKSEPDNGYSDSQLSMKCLNAWFTDERIARMDRLELIQVVEGEMQQVESLFIEKYGNPNRILINQDQNRKQLIWYSTIEGQETVLQQLTADLSDADDGLIIVQTSLSSRDGISKLMGDASVLDLIL